MARPAAELRTPYRGILLTMIVSFAVSFVFLYWKQESRRAPPLPAAAAAAPVASPPIPSIARLPEPHAVAPIAPIAQKPPVPPPDEIFEGPPLPVLFNVAQRAVRSNDAGSAGEPTRVAEVQIKSSSDKPLAITVLEANQSTRRTSQAHVFLAPNAETTVGSDDGLNMQSGDEITVRSSGFSVLTATVP